MKLMKLKSGTDIRGVAVDGVKGQPMTLTDENVTLITRAFATWIRNRTEKNHFTVAVGHDSRISADRISNAVISALTKSGATVLDCGLCTTPAMFMTTVLRSCDAAVSITASHHPYYRNGLKFFTREGGLEGSDITDILKLAEAGSFHSTDTYGHVNSIDFLSEYAAYLRKMICTGLGCRESDRPLSGLNLMVDAGNGAGGFYATQVLSRLGADIKGSVYLDPDGMFPNHIPNPENEYAMQCACKATLNAKADLGIIFDTDVDRAGCVGPYGREINRNRLVALASVLATEDTPGGTIVTDSVTSDGLREFIEKELGGHHYRFRRGYKNVIDEAIRLCGEGIECPLAIETSGHAAFRSNYFLDDGAYLITRIIIKLAMLKKEGRSIEELIDKLKEPAEQCEIRLDITEEDFRPVGERTISALEAYSAAHDGWHIAPDNHEGIRVSCDEGDGWFLLRLSVHDPVMPMNFESNSEGGVRKMVNAVHEFMKTQSGIDCTPFEQYLG
jgi:phosphomannomutase